MDDKRISFFRKSPSKDGIVVLIHKETTFAELLHIVKEKFGIHYNIKLCNAQGAVIDDIKILRDEDVIIVYEIVHEPSDAVEEWIRMNVGGKIFVTTRNTLTCKEPDCMLAKMFNSDQWTHSKDKTGAYLIDRSSQYFEPILNYLRHGQIIIDKHVSIRGVLEEARFFGIESLVSFLEEKALHDEESDCGEPITRHNFSFHLLSNPVPSSRCTGAREMRCQGLNFDGCDLSKLDLRYINFKYASLVKANLTGANLTGCSFERANMSQSVLNGCTLIAVHMHCVNLDHAKLLGCNFEDPAGEQAILEGASMKYVKLDGSQMPGVNLRVANLRKSSLQNCNLRGAVLAGADLEDCDLNGSDLQEANLRGANLKGASFELMVNPLHMSQTIN